MMPIDGTLPKGWRARVPPIMKYADPPVFPQRINNPLPRLVRMRMTYRYAAEVHEHKWLMDPHTRMYQSVGVVICGVCTTNEPT
jgi:hypothetical protein